MGGGYWKREDFARYSAGMVRKVRADGNIDTSGMRGAQDMYRAVGIDPKLDPYKVMRECCDNDEHPATVPVILALDVTGSMGGALPGSHPDLPVRVRHPHRGAPGPDLV